jgi:clan AA aspartic protease (TIGR02281 family)
MTCSSRTCRKLWADERAVRQIVLNLLSNSIKFTPQGGEIWLKVGWTASGGQYLSVKDTGSGIPEEEIPIVLASFGQGSNSIKSAEQGAGLRPSDRERSLIDLHGGTFTLEIKLRIGTEVIVTFPPERVMSALAPMASVVLTYETAKAAGLPLELLDYSVDVETAGGRVRAARLTLDRLSVGKLVERSVPALVVPRGQMKSNLLGMSFLNRLESWEVRPDKLMLRGYP